MSENTEEQVDVVDTGGTGGAMFDFAWSSDDPLSKHIAPRRYGRVDIDYGGDTLAEGVIMTVEEARDRVTDEAVDGTWILRISVGPRDAVPVADAVLAGNIAVRVHS